MIRIHRAAAPARLTGEGAAQTLKDCEAYEADPGYAAGTITFDITSKIYGHDDVKSALLRAQHRKCCYCERKILATGYGDVEHYRPKNGVRQDPNTSIEKPGYYWLGYVWTNLLVSCSVCNTSWKQTYFPLENPQDRARSHRADLALERPWLIDPAAEDPRTHIRFSGDAPYALSRRGEETIARLGLAKRGDLVEARLALLSTLRMLRDVASALPPHAPEHQEAMAYIQACAEPSAEFSSMVADFITEQALQV